MRNIKDIWAVSVCLEFPKEFGDPLRMVPDEDGWEDAFHNVLSKRWSDLCEEASQRQKPDGKGGFKSVLPFIFKDECNGFDIETVSFSIEAARDSAKSVAGFDRAIDWARDMLHRAYRDIQKYKLKPEDEE